MLYNITHNVTVSVNGKKSFLNNEAMMQKSNTHNSEERYSLIFPFQ